VAYYKLKILRGTAAAGFMDTLSMEVWSIQIKTSQEASFQPVAQEIYLSSFSDISVH
jgi:hypothetical protein